MLCLVDDSFDALLGPRSCQIIDVPNTGFQIGEEVDLEISDPLPGSRDTLLFLGIVISFSLNGKMASVIFNAPLGRVPIPRSH